MGSKIINEPFRTAYNYDNFKGLPFSYKTESGSPMKNEYSYKRDNFGRKVLEKSGETNLYELIQLSLEETKIENILARCAAGDTSMLHPTGGQYLDTTEMPNNLIEAQQAIQQLENTWADLPMEIKNKYNNDVEYFIGQSGKEEWLRDMGLLPAEAKTIAQMEEAANAGVAPKTIDARGEVNE